MYGSLRYSTLTPATGPGHVWVHCLTVNVWPGSGARGALAAAPQAPPGPAHGPPAAPPPANHHHSLSKKAEFSGSTALLSFQVARVGNAAGRQVRGVGRVDTATAAEGQRAGAAWHRPLPLSPTLLASVHHPPPQLSVTHPPPSSLLHVTNCPSTACEYNNSTPGTTRAHYTTPVSRPFLSTVFNTTVAS